MTKSSNVESLVASLRKSAKGRGGLSAEKRRALVRDHGVDAVRALLVAEHPKWNGEVCDLGADGTPWPYAGLGAGEVARRALGPLAERLPRVVAKLATAELVVTVRHTPEAGSPDLGGWFLLYAVPADHGPELWIAGPPEPAPELDVQGWTLPAPLRELYAQHHGLGVLCDEHGWTGVDPGVQPALLVASPALPDIGNDESPDPADLLRFTRGTGEAGESGWCFVRSAREAAARETSTTKARKAKKTKKDPEGGVLTLCNFDDQFGLLGEPAPFDFWGLLDRYMIGDPDDELPVAEHF